MSLTQLLPSRADLAPLPGSWRRDLLAGVTVGIVALPLALAFGVSSGVGAAAGIVTAVVAGVVAAVFGGSHVQVSGPTGAMAVILAPIVAAQGAGAVVVICVLAGLVLVVAALARLGRIVTYVPWPVIEGFTAGIAVIIALQQVPFALGGTTVPGHGPIPAAWEAVTAATWPTAGITLALVVGVGVVMEACRRLPGAFPGSLIGVGLATLAVELLHLDVPRIGALPDSLPAPALPALDLGVLPSLAGPALAVAALAAIESLLSARVAAGMAPTGRVLPDRELFGQGLASIASGLFGGMPATGAIARTAVNVRSGARSRLAAITHAVVVAAIIVVGGTLAARIPLAALAGVLIVTAARMVSTREVVLLVRSSHAVAATFAVTVVCTVALDLITAVEIGIALAAFFALRTLAATTRAEREELPGPPAPGDEHIALLRLDGSLFFGAADRVLDEIADLTDVRVVVLRLSGLSMLDATGARRIAELIGLLESRGITAIVKGLRPDHAALAAKTGMLASLRHRAHRFDDLADAVAHARSHVERELAAIPPD